MGYNDAHQVISRTLQGEGCSACAGGQGQYGYAYTTSSNADGFNSWRYKTVETQPDGNQTITYANSSGQTMLSVYKDVTTGQMWGTFTAYDSAGRAVLNANPSAVNLPSDLATIEGDPELLRGNHAFDYQYLNDHSGLITLTDYYGSTTATETTPGAAANYPQDNTGIDATIGRVSALADVGGSASGSDESYAYQGVGAILGTRDGNGVTKAITLDPFGRTAEIKYVNASSVTTDDFAYGYDRAGNVLYKDNLLDSASSELYHSNSTTTGDSNAAYDPLNRLTGFARGALSSSGNNPGATALDTVTAAGATQSWSLDAIGNQSSVTTNGATTANGANAKNELTANNASTLAFDNNGNTLTDQNGQTYTYDAWNRSITAKSPGGAAIASYSYDPEGRRTGDSIVGQDRYYSAAGQVVEQRASGGAVINQFVWGRGFVNDLILRDDSSTGGSLGVTSSGLGQRIYSQQDANWNETSLVSGAGGVLQRFTYGSYGTLTVLTADWQTSTDGYTWQIEFQGGYAELATGLYHFGARDYNVTLGRWNEEDSARYIDGANLYQFERSIPASSLDPSGFSALYNWITFSIGAAGAAASYAVDQATHIVDPIVVVAGKSSTFVAGAATLAPSIAAAAIGTVFRYRGPVDSNNQPVGPPKLPDGHIWDWQEDKDNPRGGVFRPKPTIPGCKPPTLSWDPTVSMGIGITMI